MPKACQKHGVVPAIVTGSVEAAGKRIHEGFRLVSIMNDLGFFRAQTNAMIDAVHAAVKEK